MAHPRSLPELLDHHCERRQRRSLLRKLFMLPLSLKTRKKWNKRRKKKK
jgi:hypothetical protein